MIQNTQKPYSVAEAKKEADRFYNLAKSAETQLDLTKKEKRALEEEIADLRIEKQRVFDEQIVEKQKIEDLRQIRMDLEQDKVTAQSEIRSLQVKQKEKQKEVDQLDSTIQKGIDEVTRRSRKELVAIQDEKKAELELVSDLQSQKKTLQKSCDFLVQKIEKNTDDVAGTLTRLENLNEEEKSKKKILQKLSEKLEIVRVELDQAELSQKKLIGVEEGLKKLQKEFSKLCDDVKAKEMEFELFEETMSEKRAFLDKLEEGIDTKVRRFKSMTEEKELEALIDSIE